VFGCAPEYLIPETVLERVEQTNTCGTLESPVDVWIDEAGDFTLNIYEAD
jgi:hypothetical protein